VTAHGTRERVAPRELDTARFVLRLPVTLVLGILLFGVAWPVLVLMMIVPTAWFIGDAVRSRKVVTFDGLRDFLKEVGSVILDFTAWWRRWGFPRRDVGA
jgi:hypothetical protein